MPSYSVDEEVSTRCGYCPKQRADCVLNKTSTGWGSMVDHSLFKSLGIGFQFCDNIQGHCIGINFFRARLNPFKNFQSHVLRRFFLDNSPLPIMVRPSRTSVTPSFFGSCSARGSQQEHTWSDR